MAKIDMSKIKGMNSLGLGKQNLNEESKKLKDSRKKTSFIDMNLIDMNEDNKMSMSKVEWLEQDIKLQGLLQPLVVELLENGRYKLYAGHQRLTAIKSLRDKGEWSADNLVEVKLIDIGQVNVPDGVSRKTKEKMALRGLNIQRDKSDSDLFTEIEDWKEIYADLRANGVEVFEYGTEEKDGAKEIMTQKIKGVKTQTLVAEQLGISHAQVGKFEKVANKGSEGLIDALKTGTIAVSVASEIASKPMEQQEQILSTIHDNKGVGETITKDDVRLAEHKLKKKEKVSTIKEFESVTEDQEHAPELNGELFTDKDLKKYLKKTFSYLKNNEVRLDDVQLGKLLKSLEAIERIVVGE